MTPARTYPVHDCHAWNTRQFHHSAVARWTTCGTCGTVTAFRDTSWWRRIMAVFVDVAR